MPCNALLVQLPIWSINGNVRGGDRLLILRFIYVFFVDLEVQLLDASKNPLIDPKFGGTAVDFTQPLSPGYYTLTVNGGANSPPENFQVSMVAPGFAGAANFGGFAAPGLVGFGSFYLASPQEHSGIRPTQLGHGRGSRATAYLVWLARRLSRNRLTQTCNAFLGEVRFYRRLKVNKALPA